MFSTLPSFLLIINYNVSPISAVIGYFDGPFMTSISFESYLQKSLFLNSRFSRFLCKIENETNKLVYFPSKLGSFPFVKKKKRKRNAFYTPSFTYKNPFTFGAPYFQTLLNGIYLILTF